MLSYCVCLSLFFFIPDPVGGLNRSFLIVAFLLARCGRLFIGSVISCGSKTSFLDTDCGLGIWFCLRIQKTVMRTWIIWRRLTLFHDRMLITYANLTAWALAQPKTSL